MYHCLCVQNTLTSLREESFFAIWTKFPIKIRAPTLGSDVVSPPPLHLPPFSEKKIGFEARGYQNVAWKKVKLFQS